MSAESAAFVVGFADAVDIVVSVVTCFDLTAPFGESLFVALFTNVYLISVKNKEKKHVVVFLI